VLFRSLDLGGGARARFHNAGHILGSALVEVRFPHAGREAAVVFSGDVGRYDVALHVDPADRPACDVLVIESTYGDREHDTTPVADQVRDAFARTFARRGTVLIPAFAVGRTQQVTLILRRLMASGELPEVPIHIDSPMAIEATQVYSQHLADGNLDDDVAEDGREKLFPRKVKFHRTADESKHLNDLPGPRVIVSASGMLTGGRVLHHLARKLPDKKLLVLAYINYAEPPDSIRPRPNVVPFLCHYAPADYSRAINDPASEANRQFNDLLKRWLKISPDLMIYSYVSKSMWWRLPRPVLHNFAADVKYLHGLGGRRYYCQSSLSDWPLDGPLHYVLAKLLWNPSADPDAIAREWASTCSA